MDNGKKEWMDKLECRIKVDKNRQVWITGDMTLDVDSVEHMDVDECGVDQSRHVELNVEGTEMDNNVDVELYVDNTALCVGVDKWKVDGEWNEQVEKEWRQ
ncbi:hypothetical protein E2C01_083640 [Portunus trituberculatus]|uniref:Uncharacterized protein n=1 Tax=Portunus trituberculatus TaxID=210409 RepID=A0A5B7ISZ9_PORTR|nr:hypothetical protein [Portunus trituberculatus]